MKRKRNKLKDLFIGVELVSKLSCGSNAIRVAMSATLESREETREVQQPTGQQTARVWFVLLNSDSKSFWILVTGTARVITHTFETLSLYLSLSLEWLLELEMNSLWCHISSISSLSLSVFVLTSTQSAFLLKEAKAWKKTAVMVSLSLKAVKEISLLWFSSWLNHDYI